MVRTLQSFCVLTLIFAGIVSVLCVAQLMQGAPEIENSPDLTIIEKFRQSNRCREKNIVDEFSPLVKQAEIFALYLNPPESPEPNGVLEPTADFKRKIPIPEPERLKPKFIIIGTSYNRSRPERSMALVSEPGKEPHWVKQGARLGPFIIEKVGRGMIVYHDGDRSRQMEVDLKDSDQIAHTRRATLVSSQTEISQQETASPN